MTADLVQAEIPRGGRVGSLALAETALISLLFFVQGGFPVPGSNEPHYLSKAKHYWDPAWCANDFFCNSSDAHQVFYWTFGWLSRVLPLPALAWTGRLLTWGLMAWAWRRLSVAVVPLPFYAVLSAALFVMLNDRAHMAGEWVIGGVEAKGFAYILVFLALEAITRGKWSRAWLLLGAASSFHVLVGGWSTAAAGFAWLTLPGERPPLRKMILPLAGGALLALPGLLSAVVLTRGVPPEIVAESNRIYVFERLPHHLVLRTVSTEFLLRHAALVLAWLLMCWRLPSTPESRPVRRFVSALVLVSVVGVGISFLEAYDPTLAAGLLRFYWFRMSDAMVPLGVALLGAAWIARLHPGASRWGTAAVAAATIFGVVHFGDLLMDRRNDPRPPADKGTADLAAWRETCQWVKTNTDPDAVFLVPRLALTFRWYAQRAEVVTRKDIPQDARGIVEWWRKQHDIYARPAPDGSTEFCDSLSEVGAPRLKELAAKYGADYVITSAQPPLPLEMVGPANSVYAVYRLRGETPSSNSPKESAGGESTVSLEPMSQLQEDLAKQLAARLKQPLPGWEAQARFQPELSFGRHFAPPPASARQAAVLVLLFPIADRWHVPLTLRPAHMVDHASQISLPGGLIEPGERSQDAALRELREELGVSTDDVELVGELSPIYLFATNFHVSPWLGVARRRPAWHPNAAEVEQLLEVPVAHLIDPDSTSVVPLRHRGIEFKAPTFCWQSHCVWGATSMILSELVSILNDCGSSLDTDVESPARAGYDGAGGESS